jgi:hypothetical protein
MSLMQIVVQAAAIVTAGATTFGAAAAFAAYRLLKKHDRTLYGADHIEEWDGLVSTVENHEQALENEGIIK